MSPIEIAYIVAYTESVAHTVAYTNSVSVVETHLAQRNNISNSNICKPKSFNTYISHQLFEYEITCVNSQHENLHSIGDFVLKDQFETFV